MRQASEKLSCDAERKRALRVACNVLGFADRTESYLREKLIAKGFSFEITDETVEKMKEQGFLDERRMLVRQVELMNRAKLWGKRRILHERPMKGYAKETLAAFSFDCEELSGLDFGESCLKLLRRYAQDEPRKQYAALTRYGYSDSEIRQAMRRLREEQEDGEEEDE